MFYELSPAEMNRLGSCEVERLFSEHQAGNSVVDLGDDLAGREPHCGEDDNDAENLANGGEEGNEGNDDAVGEDIQM